MRQGSGTGRKLAKQARYARSTATDHPVVTAVVGVAVIGLLASSSSGAIKPGSRSAGLNAAGRSGGVVVFRVHLGSSVPALLPQRFALHPEAG